ncbi:MAG: DUF1080 domain-containing protein [Planctomycetes bacterium]|jgi:hypothetical protein|nr:DUF1080 domain-containing protein [Planctomycetota bacterium]
MMRMTGKAGLGIVVCVALAGLLGCQSKPEGKLPGKRIQLWNGKDFAGWTRFVAEPGVEVNDVWSVRNGVLYCSGQPNGYIRTQNRYENYHLHLEWRWPETPTNSGVLLHAGGQDQVWPVCIECQLKAGSAGDFVLMGGAALTVAGTERRNPAEKFVVIKKRAVSGEKRAGLWNTYDIYCRDGAIRCVVNGIFQNEGTKADPTSGWICLQSEGGPVEFRNIYLQSNEAKTDRTGRTSRTRAPASSGLSLDPLTRR